MIIVALGGAVGSSLRMAVSRLVDTYAVGHFPYPTMTVNVVGCLLIGVFYGLSMRGSIGGDNIKMLLTTGFCGASPRSAPSATRTSRSSVTAILLPPCCMPGQASPSDS